MIGKRIAFVMSRFPHLPETFILREMVELEDQGWEVTPYPLIRQKQTIAHRDAIGWEEKSRFTPFFSLSLILANLQVLATHPVLYLRLWTQVVWENRGCLEFLIRALVLFPKAVLMARKMLDDDIDHIHAHYATHPALVAWIVHHLTGIRYSLTVHAHDIFVEHSMLATKLRDSSFVVAISEFNRNYLSEVLGDWVREKIHVIHCGITPNAYSRRSDTTAAKDLFNMVSVGSLQQYKGHGILLRACAILKERDISLRCLIIGEGEERLSLERLITELGLSDEVELCGAKTQETVARMLPMADCFVQPSVVTASRKMEGIPVAIMEALACELPVVATAISGIPELIRDGETGYLVPPNEPGALADAIENVHADQRAARKVAQRGRALVLSEFDVRDNVRLLATFLDKTIRKATPQQIASELETASSTSPSR